MLRGNYQVNHECRRPDIAINDFEKDRVIFINRCCNTCKAHWYGREMAVTEYTGKEWDAFLEGDE